MACLETGVNTPAKAAEIEKRKTLLTLVRKQTKGEQISLSGLASESLSTAET